MVAENYLISAVTALAVFAGLFVLTTTIYAAVIGGPYMGTPKRLIRKALQMTKLKAGEKVYDLGCGNGRVLVLAAGEFGAEAIGFELSYHHYLLSKLNIFLRGLQGRAKVRWKNLYNENISDADVVFLWLTPKAFRKLEQKLTSELRPGARVITFSSPLLFWHPDEIYETSKGAKIFLYIKK